MLLRDAIYARIVWSQACFYKPYEVFAETGLDYDRAVRGFEHLAKTANDGKTALCMGIWLAKFRKDQRDFQRLSKLLPEEDIPLAWPKQLTQTQHRPWDRAAANRVLFPELGSEQPPLMLRPR